MTTKDDLEDLRSGNIERFHEERRGGHSVVRVTKPKPRDTTIAKWADDFAKLGRKPAPPGPWTKSRCDLCRHRGRQFAYGHHWCNAKPVEVDQFGKRCLSQLNTKRNADGRCTDWERRRSLWSRIVAVFR